MVRLAPRTDSDAADRQTGDDDSGPGLGRALLAALGIAAVGYLVVRWRRGDVGVSIDALPDRLADEAETVLEDAQPIEIGEPGESGGNGAESGDDEGESADAGSETDAEPDDETSVGTDDESLDTPTTDRSADEIAERAESDVQEEPAEPGEMTIDEEVADEVADEEDDRS